MGPRIASVRHVHADMAPALTESSQSHVLPVKHKPLQLTLFAPSVLSKPMDLDDLKSNDTNVIKNTINGLSVPYNFTLVEKNKVNNCILENADITMNGNGSEETINMGYSKIDNNIDHAVDQLLKNVPNNVLLDVINEAIISDANSESLPSSQNSEDTFGQALFQNVDVSDIKNNPDSRTTSSHVISSKVCSIERRKEDTEKRVNTLLQRALRIITRLLGTHSSAEINGVLESISVSYLDGTGDCSVGSLMKQLESSIQQQQVTSKNSYFGSAEVEPTDLNKTTPSLVKLNPEYQQTLEDIAGHLQTQLKAVQRAVDSDATASSSEAESCDESQNFSNSHQLELPIYKRASWRWNRDRTKIGSKWSWILTQLNDVEKKIHEYQHQHKHFLQSKGSVRLSTESNSTGGFNGGFIPIPESTSKSSALSLPNNSESCSSCARTRSYDKNLFKKRKIIKVKNYGNRQVNNYVVPVNTKCGCTSSRPPCVLCLGRKNPTQPRDQLNLFHTKQKIALVDSNYHPNISFSQDVSRRVHLEAVASTSWWQHKSQPFSSKQRKLLAASLLSSTTSTPSTPFSPDKGGAQLKKHTNSLAIPLCDNRTKRKYTKRRKTTSIGSHGNSGKNHLFESREPRPLRPKRSSSNQHWNHLLDDEGEEDEPMDDSDDDFDGYQMSPVPSPCPSNTGKEFRTRRRESSYDIDNIVIPYSVAATTRVEVLQYKEIPTPKWRFINNSRRNNGDIITPVHKPSSSSNISHQGSEEEDEVEDISDDTFRLRHEKYELEEKKKFRSYLFQPNKTRSNKRTDSRAESSGCNTPDAVSPKHQPETEGISPLTSPPIPSFSENNPELINRMKRRSTNRTVTISESSSREERCISPLDFNDEVSPYSPLQFPLTDEQYALLLKDVPAGYPIMEDFNYSYDENAPKTTSEKPESPTALMSDCDSSDEDPDDPEWTFETSKSQSNDRFQQHQKKYFDFN